MSTPAPEARRVSPRAAAWVSAVLSGWIAASGCAQDTPRDCPANAADCYPYGNTRIDLKYSPYYETVTLPANDVAGDIEALSAVIEGEDIGTVEQLPSLADERTIVVRLGDAEQAPSDPDALIMSLEQTVEDFNRRRYGDRPERAVTGRDLSGNPVYFEGDAHFVMVNEVIVQFVPDSAEADRLALLDRYDAEILTDRGARNWYVVKFERLNARDALRTANAIHHENIVEFAQPNFVELVSKNPREGRASVPLAKCPAMPAGLVDPLFAYQWYLENDGSGGTPFADINAIGAWQVTTGLTSVVIAIIDDGVSPNHNDLAGKLVSGYDAYAQDGNATPNPWDWHGTAVAGVAAAVTGNSHGIKGIASNVSIMPVRIYAYPSSVAYDADMPHAAIKDGIESAADTAHVLNNSWTKSQSVASNNAIESAIDYALSKGRIVVFAVGNQGSAVRYPALLSVSVDSAGRPRPVIAVGATDRNDKWVEWSNAGGDRVNVVAPGLDVVSTDIAGVNGFCAADYVIFSGTSASAPLVSGTAALMLSSDPTLAPSTVREKLQATAEDLGFSVGYDQETGHGRIDACRALSGADCERHGPEVPGVPSRPTNLQVQ